MLAKYISITIFLALLPLGLFAEDKIETAVFGGGCFWGMEAVFEELSGVKDVRSGYSGGESWSAFYPLVGTGLTNHAEAVIIKFDPDIVSFNTLLEVFFLVAHDPTQLNYQGPDKGHEYRSVVFYANDGQRVDTLNFIKQLEKEKAYKEPIVTEVSQLKEFYDAEKYHQDFIVNNPDHPYVVYWDIPKLNKLREGYPQLLKK